MTRVPTASQTVGPFFSFALDHPAWADLTDGGKAEGEAIRIEGRVTDGDGAPVPDAILEIWQANAAGKYAHPEDRQQKELDRHFRGFGRCATKEDGTFAFATIRPGPVPGRGNALQAPHITFCIFARGLLRHLYTRLYFEDRAALNDADPLLASIDDPALRRTLIARETAPATYRFDIRLQGEGETAFFEV
jgi:protocatechuate 3,4-dioxygenase, alpha subunit